MYAKRELKRLALHKARLRRSIARHRGECTTAAASITRPLAWLDRALAFWRRLAPFTQLAAVPLGILVTRSAFSRRGLLGSLARWFPLAFAATRGIGALITRP